MIPEHWIIAALAFFLLYIMGTSGGSEEIRKVKPTRDAETS